MLAKERANMDTQKRKLTLDQVEQDAKEAGRVAKINLLSGENMVSFATDLARLYLQKHVEQLDITEITLYMLHFPHFFRVGYMETERSADGVSYFENPWR
jgi:hypothetical protein